MTDSHSIKMLPSADIEYTQHGVKARTAWGSFDVPRDVYARSVRLDHWYPRNYDGGYLAAWCRAQRFDGV